jgi:hypothetical protein
MGLARGWKSRSRHAGEPPRAKPARRRGRRRSGEINLKARRRWDPSPTLGVLAQSHEPLGVVLWGNASWPDFGCHRSTSTGIPPSPSAKETMTHRVVLAYGHSLGSPTLTYTAARRLVLPVWRSLALTTMLPIGLNAPLLHHVSGVVDAARAAGDKVSGRLHKVAKRSIRIRSASSPYRGNTMPRKSATEFANSIVGTVTPG